MQNDAHAIQEKIHKELASIAHQVAQINDSTGKVNKVDFLTYHIDLIDALGRNAKANENIGDQHYSIHGALRKINTNLMLNLKKENQP
jgi:hypothetical protein